MEYASVRILRMCQPGTPQAMRSVSQRLSLLQEQSSRSRSIPLFAEHAINTTRTRTADLLQKVWRCVKRKGKEQENSKELAKVEVAQIKHVSPSLCTRSTAGTQSVNPTSAKPTGNVPLSCPLCSLGPILQAHSLKVLHPR